MTRTTASLAERFYALLLRAYPVEFRLAYTPLMMQAFRDRRRHCRPGETQLRFWSAILADTARTLLEEHMQTLLPAARSRPPALAASLGFVIPAAALVSFAVHFPAWHFIARFTSYSPLRLEGPVSADLFTIIAGGVVLLVCATLVFAVVNFHLISVPRGRSLNRWHPRCMHRAAQSCRLRPLRT